VSFTHSGYMRFTSSQYDKIRVTRQAASNHGLYWGTEKMMAPVAILIVVWLGFGGATNYQVPFSSIALCDAARKAVLDEAAAARAKLEPNSTILTSAVCLRQNTINP